MSDVTAIGRKLDELKDDFRESCAAYLSLRDEVREMKTLLVDLHRRLDQTAEELVTVDWIASKFGVARATVLKGKGGTRGIVWVRRGVARRGQVEEVYEAFVRRESPRARALRLYAGQKRRRE